METSENEIPNPNYERYKTHHEGTDNESKRRIWRFFIFALATGILMCLLLGCKSDGRFIAYLELSGTCLLIGGASFGIGALSGFLFGIPKIINSENITADPSKKRKTISQNDNLVQISDWLTKIIVGIGLTQLYQIPGALKVLGNYFSSIFNNNTSGNIALSVIFYFLVFGFLFSYLWSRLYFTQMIQEVEISLSFEEKIVNKVRGITDKKVSQIEEITKGMVDFFNETQQKTTDLGGGKTITNRIDELKAELNPVSETDTYDPQKGKWGGLSENNDRKITAKIELSDTPTLYKVILEVSSTNPSNPLSGFVKFHLHPSFNNSEPVIAVIDGIATLVLNKVYGAFTAGAEADDGKTLLEIDLAELSNAPEDFKAR